MISFSFQYLLYMLKLMMLKVKKKTEIFYNRKKRNKETSYF